MYVGDYIVPIVIITFLFWTFAFLVMIGAENKTHHQIALGLIFWPIGFPIMALVGLFNLIRLCFSKEEEEEGGPYTIAPVCKYCSKTLRVHNDKCPNCSAPVLEEK